MAEYQYINGVRVPIQNEQKSELELLNTNKNPIDKIGFVTNRKTNAVQNSIMAGFVNGINTGYSVSDEDAKLAKKYGISVGMYDNKYSLERKIAQVQSGWEQFGRSIGQIAVNEVMLGTLLGFSDLYDWFANLGKAYGEDDWNNDFGRVLTSAQDKLKEDWTIYRENPDKSFNISDSGWWWDNFITVGSTASLLIPSMAITKGLSLAGKGAKYLSNATKLDRGLHKAGRWLGKTAPKLGIENPYTLTNNLKRFTNAAVPSVISRQMEDMLEGRETYKQVYENTMQQFANMSNAEREEFYQRNQDIIYDENGNLKSDEDIAKYIADKAATYTFVNDFKYIGFDFLQFNSILRFGKKPLTRGVSQAQNRLLDQLAHSSERAAENIIERSGRKGVFKEALNFYAKNPRIAIKQVAAHSEFTEGLEEIGQGITQENALGEYEKFFNPNYSNRTLASQLSDSQLWEQGFWGMLGGMIFQGAGKGIKKGGKYIYKKINADKLSQQDIERLEATEETLREKEINSRINNIETLKNKLELWKQGYNPQVKRTNIETGETVQNDYTSTDGFRLMTEDEKGMVLEDIINEYLLNMTTGAVEVGNGDLLEAFITDERFKKYISELNSDDNATKDIYDKIVNNYKNVKELYYNNLNKIFGSIDIDSEYLGKSLALNMTRNSLFIDNISKEIKRIDDTIAARNESTNLVDLYHTANLARETGIAIDNLLEQARDIQQRYENKQINSTFAKTQLSEIYKAIDKLMSNTNISEIYTEIPEILDKNGNVASEKTINRWLEHYLKIRPTYQEFKNKKDIKIDDIENLVNDFNIMLNESSKRFANAEKEQGTPTNETKDLINDKIQQELQLAIKQSEELNSQEEIQEAYDDMYAAATDIASNRLVKARDEILDYITNSENPQEAYEDLMSNNAPQKIQDLFDYFKVGHALYQEHATMFQAAAMFEQKKNDISTDTPENINDNKEIQENPIQQSPSTGEQERIENESPDIAAVLAQAEEEDIKARDETQDNINTRQRIKIRLENVLYDEIFPKLTSEEKRDLRENGINSDTYKKIHSILFKRANELRGKEAIIDKELDDIANSSLAMYMKIIADNISNVEAKAKYNKFVSDLLGLNEERSADTDLVENDITEKQDDAAKNIIKEYISNIKGKEINGKPIIDVDNLFEHLLNLYEKDVVYYINPILVHLQHHINDYYISDTTTIKRYIGHPYELVQKLASIKIKKDILGQSDNTYGNTAAFHAQIPTKAQVGQRLMQGKKVTIPEDEKIIETWFTRFGEIRENKALEYKQSAIQAYKDYIRAINYYITHDDCKVYAYSTSGSISYRICPNNDRFDKEKLGEKEYQPLEIGFVAKVEKSSDNTIVKRKRTKNGLGIFFSIKKNINGTYSSNMDNYFLPIITQSTENGKKIYELLTRDRSEKINKEDIKFLNNYFRDLLDNGGIVLHKDNVGRPDNINNEKEADSLLYEYLYPILIDAQIRLSQSSIEDSYEILKEKMHDNYIKTYEIQQKLENGEEVEMKPTIVNTNTIQRDNEVRDITADEFDKEENKLVYIGKDNQIHIDGIDSVFLNINKLKQASFGIVLDIVNGNPLVAWAEPKSISSNERLYNSLNIVIKGLLNKYFTGGRTKNSYTEFRTSLHDLIALNSSPFNISERQFKNLMDAIYKTDPKTVDIDKIAKDILSHVKFNFSYQLMNKKLDKENKYIEIKDNKIVIKLDEDYIYDDLFDFVTRTRSFTISQSLVSPLDNLQEFGDRNLFFAAMTEISSPVEGNISVGTFTATVNALKTANKRKSISVRNLLKAAGISESDTNILLGTNSGISFIVDKVYFDANSKREERARYDLKTKRIYFTQHFTNIDNENYRKEKYKRDLVRLLIHENIHRRFDELDDNQKRYVIKELTKLFRASINEILNDIENGTNIDIALQLGDLFAHSNKALITDNKQKTDYIKRRLQDLINEVDSGKIKDVVIEEYLAESLSQQSFITYLNDKNYTGEQYAIAGEDENNKTIWQKIVDLIVEFFSNFIENYSVKNLHNSENISIFANEYRLLSSIGRTDVVNETVIEMNNQEEVIETVKPEETKQESKEIEPDDTLSDEDFADIMNDLNDTYDDKFTIRDATTKLVESEIDVRSRIADKNSDIDISGTLQAKDMINIAKAFGIDKQAEISSMINSDAFKYACK